MMSALSLASVRPNRRTLYEVHSKITL